MNGLKKITLEYIDDTYSDTKTEVLDDILQFNFIVNVMVFDYGDGKTYIVRETAKVLNYTIKQQPFVKAGKTK